MRIRDVAALKIWLKDTVSKISDAEPDDLAKYILALLKKDKSEKELEDLCEKELQIFFRESTMEFLSELFSALRTESYISEKTKNLKRELKTDSRDRTGGSASEARAHSLHDDDRTNIPSKSGAGRTDDKDAEEAGRVKLSRPDGREIRHRLGDGNSWEHRRHRDDHERRDRRRRSRSRSPFSRRRAGTGRHPHDDPRAPRFRRRSRSRNRSSSRSPFTHSGFRSAKYFNPRGRSPSVADEAEQPPKKMLPGHSRSSSLDSKEDKNYRITIPLDNIMKSKLIPASLHKSSSFRKNPDLPDESPIPVLDTSVPLSGPSLVVMTTPPGSQPSLVRTVPPPPLPLGFGVPPPIAPFSAGLIPAARQQQQQPIVAGQPPPTILQHFARYPAASVNIVPSMPLGLNFPPQQVVLPKESGARQVVSFAALNSYPSFLNPLSIKSRLGIKVDDGQRLDGGNTLLINNIPPVLNNISSINQQFSKFGPITNIQVQFAGNPGSALVTFGSHSAAESAYNSSEPVFNNRFIEVLWHHQDLSQNSRVVLPETRKPVKERLGGLAPSELKVQVAMSVEPEAEKENSGMPGSVEDGRVEVVAPSASDASLKRTVVLMPSKNQPTHSAPLQIPRASASFSSSTKIRRTQTTTTTTSNKKGELMKEVMKRRLELEKKKRVFLEEQLKKQKSLLDELQKPGLSDEERSSMKKKLKEMTFQSRKLKSELDGSMRAMKPTPLRESAFSPSVLATELKKQILDAELDLMSRAKEGVDTSELEKKIQLMKGQVSYLTRRQAKKPAFTGQPTNRPFRAIQGKAAQQASRLLDRRPRQLVVSGFQPGKKNAVIAHLGRFGKMEKFEDVGGKGECIAVTYSTRNEAEKVARLAIDFEDCKLHFSWPKTSESHQPTQVQVVQQSKTNVPSTDEALDEDEEDNDREGEEEDDDDSDTMIELMIEDDGTNDLVENSLIDGDGLFSLS